MLAVALGRVLVERLDVAELLGAAAGRDGGALLLGGGDGGRGGGGGAVGVGGGGAGGGGSAAGREPFDVGAGDDAFFVAGADFGPAGTI